MKGPLSRPVDPIVLDVNTAHDAASLAGPGVLVFGAIVCFKKWLLDWVDRAAEYKATSC